MSQESQLERAHSGKEAWLEVMFDSQPATPVMQQPTQMAESSPAGSGGRGELQFQTQLVSHCRLSSSVAKAGN